MSKNSFDISPANEKPTLALIERMGEGDTSAFDEISEKYSPLVKSVYHSFEPSFTEGGGTEAAAELRQELDIALYRAAKTYDQGKGKVTFGNYAKRCLTNCAISQLRKIRSSKRKHERAIRKLESALSYEKHQHTFDSYFAGYGLIDRETVMLKISEILSSYEYAVFCKYLDGMGAREISRELETDEKSVNNAVYRSKRKVSALMKGISSVSDAEDTL